MNIEIRKLTPDLAEEYACFFDTTYHWGGYDTRCYCITWCGDNVYNNGGRHWFDSPDERRIQAVSRVRNGDIQGYLAYLDNKIVGWCSANIKSDCQAGINYLRTDGDVPLEECREGEKVKYIFCYAIAPEVQRKGVATQLLKYVCRDAANENFDYVETYINKEIIDTSRAYNGWLAMYEKCGFSIHAERNNKVVMRKLLN
jgi:GNAT superfamily N-acetyltransferase